MTNTERNTAVARRRAAQAAWAVHGNTILARGRVSLNISGTFSNALGTNNSSGVALAPDSAFPVPPGSHPGNINSGLTLTGGGNYSALNNINNIKQRFIDFFDPSSELGSTIRRRIS
jgi:hypothetical protein